MTLDIKRVSFLFLLALLTSTTVIFAQDSDTITVVGSGIVNPIVESLAEANDTDILSITTTGTPAGFEQFCAGEADIATATRAISADEDASCISNDTIYSEFLVAHSILGFAVSPTVDFVQCLSATDLNTLFTPSATGQITNWTAYDESVDDLPITFILPQDNTVEYLILDSIVDGDGLRRDGETYTDVDSALEQVADSDGAIAVIPYTPDLSDNDSILLLDVNNNTTTGCASPTVENVENRLYTVSQQMFMYVNRASLDSNEALLDLMTFITSTDSADVVADTGYVAPSEETITLNAQVLSDPEAGRLFSGTESTFTIPPNLIGQIDISGAANAFNLLNSTASQLTANNQQLTINLDIEGQTAGIRRLCNGETDIAILESELADSALDGCSANDINTIPVVIGTQATVLVSNAADTHTMCLTTEQIHTVWEASATDTITNWSNVDETFPDEEMTLFGLHTQDEFSDILLSTVAGPIAPIRFDTEQDSDALYRAAAVANVEGGLTYMSWTDYRRVLNNNQQNIQLVNVDAGSGCIAPSITTITGGSYALTRSASLLVNEVSLTDISLQSFLWTLFSDQGWTTIDREGFVGIDFGDLPTVRAELETQFSLAETNAVASVDSPDAESTAEPTTDNSADEADTGETSNTDEAETDETSQTDEAGE